MGMGTFFIPSLLCLSFLFCWIEAFQKLHFEKTNRLYQKRMMVNSKNADESFEQDGFVLQYMTDVEGNLDYFMSQISNDSVLEIQEQSKQGFQLNLRSENSFFVFGGDAVDKGPGDIRLVRALVDLKRRYPERVFLLVGNRDLNKLRFTAELSSDDMKRPIHDIPPPHWDPSAPSLQQFLQTQKDKLDDPSVSLQDLNTRVNRLHYMLQHTLGCPHTFGFRKEELAILRSVPESCISDQDVLESFLYEAEKGSLMEYLQLANVAVVIGNTLFCHGAVDRNTIQYVPKRDTKFENPPSKPPPDRLEKNLHLWVQALNSFLKFGLEDYQQRPYWNDDRSSRGGECLLALQNRPAMWGRSIVSNCYGDGGCITTETAALERNDPDRRSMESTNPLVFEKVCSDPLDQQVANWLLEHGIQRVVIGHKPTGDCPAVLSATYTGVEICSADTSYSDSSAKDNRGKATSVVLLKGDSNMDNHLEIQGTLHDSTRHHSVFGRLFNGNEIDFESGGDPNLGRQCKDGWWIKARESQGAYRLTRGSGRRVEHKRVDKSEIEKLGIETRLFTQEVTNSTLAN